MEEKLEEGEAVSCTITTSFYPFGLNSGYQSSFDQGNSPSA